MQKIICLVGEPASGKGAVVCMMKEYGFSVLSLSEEVINYTKGLGYENIPRSKISELANDARKKYGPDCFARPMVNNQLFKSAPLLVVDSVRNTTEISLIKNSANIDSKINIWSLQADPELRYQRTTFRKYPWDPKTFDEFLENDKSELGLNGEICNQQNAACIELADVHIWNNGTLEELRDQVAIRLQLYNGVEGSSLRQRKEG